MNEMIYLIKSLYIWLLPPGIFIMACGWMAWRCRRDGRLRRNALSLGLLIWLLSMPAFSNAVIGVLESKHAVPAKVQGDVVVLLGGGIVVGNRDLDGWDTFQGGTANRTITAIRLAKKEKLPLLYSGGKMFAGDGDQAALVKRYAVSLGLSPDRVFIEGESLNTTQSVRLMQPILRRQGWKRPVVVTSAYHMARSAQIFKLAGVDAQPWPCDFRHSRGKALTYRDFLPEAGALETTAVFIREGFGLLSLKTPYLKW
jgi:uncharacterized SAM-binding protein YcdF (DUF218 family)